MRTIIKATPFISAESANRIPSDVENEPLPGSAESARDEENWKAIIDHRLIEWGRDPSQLDDEGTITPSKQTIQFAIALAWMWRNMGLPAPNRVVPDSHGGIVFEFHQSNLREVFRLSQDISLEYSVFENSRIVTCQRFPSPFIA